MVKPLFQFCSSSLLALLSLGITGASAIAQTGNFTTEQISVTLQADPIQNYSRLLEQVVVRANGAIANTFETNPSADPIELTVLINRHGNLLPVLTADISREQWQQQPNIQRWARYSNSVRILLGYAPSTTVAARPQPPRRAIIADAETIDELD